MCMKRNDQINDNNTKDVNSSAKLTHPRSLPGGSALSKSHTERIAQAEHDMAMQGKRILGFARGPSMDALEFAGLVALYDPPRPGVRESVATLKASGVRVREPG